MNVFDFIHDAIRSRYPGIQVLDYVWQDTGGEMPEMVVWPEDQFGVFNLDEVLTIAQTMLESGLLAQVKAEAGRRILDRFPLWKQNNMLMRALSLTQKGEANWTPEEASEVASLQADQEWILAVREASDVLEAMDPIPDNISDDQWWPA